MGYDVQKVCTTGLIIIRAVGLAAACIMCFRLVYCNASTREVLWMGTELITQEIGCFSDLSTEKL